MIGLIVLPFLVYMLSFAIHFAVLTKTGPGDAQMSSLFQANLQGTEVGKGSPLEIAYGSKATIKNMGYGGGKLALAAVYPSALEADKLLQVSSTRTYSTGSLFLVRAGYMLTGVFQNVSRRLFAATGYLLSPQGCEQRLVFLP